MPPYPGEYSLSCLRHSDKAECLLDQACEKATCCLAHTLPTPLTLPSSTQTPRFLSTRTPGFLSTRTPGFLYSGESGGIGRHEISKHFCSGATNYGHSDDRAGVIAIGTCATTSTTTTTTDNNYTATKANTNTKYSVGGKP